MSIASAAAPYRERIHDGDFLAFWGSSLTSLLVGNRIEALIRSIPRRPPAKSEGANRRNNFSEFSNCWSAFLPSALCGANLLSQIRSDRFNGIINGNLVFAFADH
jgi:hypothetical protein